MGRHIPNTAAHDPVAVTLAGEGVAQGDWVRVEASGLARKALEGVPLGLNNTGPGVTGVAGLGGVAHVAEANYGGSPSNARILAVLGNGNVAALHTGNGTTASAALTCRVYAPNNARVAVVPVSAAASIGSFRVVRLGAGHFAVGWTEADILKLALFNNTGTPVAPAATVAQTGGSDFGRWNMAALANGDVVLAYDKAGTGGVFFSRHGVSGALQGAETLIEAGTAAGCVCVLPLAAGGFLVYYLRSTTTAAYRFARYGATGVLQGGLTTVAVAPGGSLSVDYSESAAIELSNGSIALVDPSTTTVSAARLYDSTGTYISTVVNQSGVGSGSPARTAIKARAGGGFYISLISGNLRHVSNAGVILQTASSISLAATGASHAIIDRVGTGPLVWGNSFYYTGESYSGVLAALALDSQFAPEATALTVSSSNAYGYYGNWAEMMPCGLLAYTYCHASVSGVSTQGRLSPQAASLMGIATSPASDGELVSVATTGRWRANQASASMAFDRRSASPVGAKATVLAGQLVVLAGAAT